MKVQCKNCHPEEGIEIPDFSDLEKKLYRSSKEKSALHTVKKLMEEKRVSHRDAKYIVTHINVHPGHCNCCKFQALEEEYVKCPKCGALNLNWDS